MRATGAKRPVRRMVVRAFEGPDRAQTALAELKDAGFRPEQVSVVARDPGVSRQVVKCGKMGTYGGHGRLLRALMAHGVLQGGGA